MTDHPKKKDTSKPTKSLGNAAGRFARRYPVVVFALVLAVGMVGASLAFAYKANKSVFSSSGGFDTSKVVPQPVSMPSKTPSQTFTADSIKQYNGQNGQPCYVAVKGTVYEIKDSSYWKEGKHTPSNGQGYCGADMTETIKKSPHGEAILGSLSQVGVFK